jgi:hypothetical protein
MGLSFAGWSTKELVRVISKRRDDHGRMKAEGKTKKSHHGPPGSKSRQSSFFALLKT